MKRTIFGELEVKELQPYTILTHSHSAWGVVLPLSEPLLQKLEKLQDKIGLFPGSYVKQDILEPSDLLREILMLEAVKVEYKEVCVVSIYSLAIGLRYLKAAKMTSTVDLLIRDWGEIYLEMEKLDKRKFLRKGDQLFPLSALDPEEEVDFYYYG